MDLAMQWIWLICIQPVFGQVNGLHRLIRFNENSIFLLEKQFVLTIKQYIFILKISYFKPSTHLNKIEDLDSKYSLHHITTSSQTSLFCSKTEMARSFLQDTVYSTDHRMVVWVVKDLKDHLIANPCCE